MRGGGSSCLAPWSIELPSSHLLGSTALRSPPLFPPSSQPLLPRIAAPRPSPALPPSLPFSSSLPPPFHFLFSNEEMGENAQLGVLPNDRTYIPVHRGKLQRDGITSKLDGVGPVDNRPSTD